MPVEERLRAWCRGPVGAALYGAGGWALCRHNVHLLRRWEFNHIRAFLKMKRTSDTEGNHEYNRRTNRKIYELFVKYKLDPIYVKVLKMTFNWAKTWWTFKSDDGARPLYDYMNCRPAAAWEETRTLCKQWDYNNRTGWRHQHSGRRLQWEDGLNSSLPHWRRRLEDSPGAWHTYRKEFLNNITFEYNLKAEGLAGFEQTPRPGSSASGRKKRKCSDLEPARGGFSVYDRWALSDSLGGDLYNTISADCLWERPYTLEFVADNETLVNIVSGTAAAGDTHKDTITHAIGNISEMMVGYNWGPRCVDSSPIKWVRREFNKEADYVANFCMDAREDFEHVNTEFLNTYKGNITNIQCWSDGGHRPEHGISSFAWVVKGWVNDHGPRILAVGGVFQSHSASSSLEVEAKGFDKATEACLGIISGTINHIKTSRRCSASSGNKRAKVFEALVKE